MINPITFILNRFFHLSHIRFLCEALLLVFIYPLIRWIVVYSTDTISFNVTSDRLLYVLMIAPWFETLLCFVPIIEILRKFKLSSWIIVIFSSFIFALPHSSILLGFYLGIVFSIVYIVARRNSFFHAFLYCTSVHFIYNFLIMTLYSITN